MQMTKTRVCRGQKLGYADDKNQGMQWTKTMVCRGQKIVCVENKN